MWDIFLYRRSSVIKESDAVGRRDCHNENREECGYFVEAKRWVTYLAHTDAVGL